MSNTSYFRAQQQIQYKQKMYDLDARLKKLMQQLDAIKVLADQHYVGPNSDVEACLRESVSYWDKIAQENNVNPIDLRKYIGERIKAFLVNV